MVRTDLHDVHFLSMARLSCSITRLAGLELADFTVASAGNLVPNRPVWYRGFCPYGQVPSRRVPGSACGTFGRSNPKNRKAS